jgi:hypothetical protein
MTTAWKALDTLAGRAEKNAFPPAPILQETRKSFYPTKTREFSMTIPTEPIGRPPRLTARAAAKNSGAR